MEARAPQTIYVIDAGDFRHGNGASAAVCAMHALQADRRLADVLLVPGGGVLPDGVTGGGGKLRLAVRGTAACQREASCYKQRCTLW